MQGVRLELTHPLIATVDCDHCLKWIYDFDQKSPGYCQPIPSRKRDGSFVARHHGTPPPCRDKQGCPKGSPENSRSLTPQNRRAYEHYLECKAVGQFPDDAIVKQNAAIVAAVERAVESRRRDQFELTLVKLVSRR